MAIRFLCLVAFLAIASGCGLKAHTYVMSRDRVGIEKGSGNAGYLMGTPKYIEPEKKTRQVYILEITKAIPEKEAKKIQQEIDTTTQTTVVTSAPAAAPEAAPAPAPAAPNKIVIPRIEDEAPAAAAPVAPEAVKTPVGPTEATTYTVLKDDTLQKIASKFYGSHKAWYRIYKANKDKIKNPNVVKPGIVLTIPAAK